SQGPRQRSARAPGGGDQSVADPHQQDAVFVSDLRDRGRHTDGRLRPGALEATQRVARMLERVQLVVVLLVAGIQTTFFHPPQWNQSARLAATVAFVEPNTPYTGTFRIDGLLRGDRLPTEDWAEAHGAFYSNKAPGVSLLGIVPYYAIYRLERAAKLPPRT